MIELVILLLFMIAAAIIAVEIEDLLSAVVAVGAVGLLVSTAFLILKAPDLAITQLVVEILCIILLVRAAIKRDIYSKSCPLRRFTFITSIAAIVVFLSFAYVALKDVPDFGNALMRVSGDYIAEGLRKTGAANLVTSVILDFRAYDTLGEATVLFTAVIGVLAIMRRIGRKKKEVDTE